jgi:hypothetical protein
MRKEGRAEDGEVRAEYDFSTARRNPYAERANGPSNIAFIEPDLFEAFPTSEAVNEALRLVLRAGELATRNQSHPSSKAS